MENDFDFLSTIGVDWPQPTIAVELPALPVLEDPLACLQPSSHAADALIRELMRDDLIAAVTGTSPSELRDLANQDQLLKRAEFVNASLQSVEEVSNLISCGLSKSTAEFAASTPPTRPGQIPTRPTPLQPVRIPRTGKHRAALEKMLTQVFPVTGYSRSVRDAWDAVVNSMEDFVVRAVANCA